MTEETSGETGRRKKPPKPPPLGGPSNGKDRIQNVDDVISAVLALDRALERGEAYDIQRVLSRATPRDLSRVYKAFASKVGDAPSEALRRRLAARVRMALSAWDAMIICADLAAVRRDSRHPIEDRMRAIAEEPFFWDSRIQSVDLSLYKRNKEETDGGADASEAGGEVATRRSDRVRSKKLVLQHCFAVRLPAGSDARERPSSGGDIGSSYRDLLRDYMEKNGSSIDLDGHISRDPRFANKGEAGKTRDDDVDHDAKVYVSPVDAGFTVTIKGEALDRPIPGDDSKFISDVVERAFGIDITDQPILHFMEGIDKNFATEEQREGITAHMFLVYKHPPDVQESSELARNIQLLLLRFCAYYMDDEANKKELLARDEGQRANKVAEAAQRSRASLREKAKSVQVSIKALTALADDMEASMQENPDISRFILWLRDIVPLFKTGVPLPLPGVIVDVLGNHNAWGHDQLAAALWAYARLDPPSHLSDKDARSMVSLWNASMMNLGDDEIQSRLPRMIVHRQGIFQSMKRVRKGDLDNAFEVMKRWNAKVEDMFKEGSLKSEFFVSQLLFLLGQKSFMTVSDENDNRFEFVSQTMVEGLVHFANNIDRGLSDDKLRDTLRVFGEEASISGGLTDAEVTTSSSDDDSDPNKDAIDQPVRYLGEDHLIVRIRQKPVLSARGVRTKDKLTVEDAALGNFTSLLKAVMAKKAPDSAEKTSWRDEWNKGGRQETTMSLGRALGISETYELERNGIQEPYFARVGGGENWIRVYVDVSLGHKRTGAELPDAKSDESKRTTTIAMLRCYPDEHLYEFRFRRKEIDIRFSAMK